MKSDKQKRPHIDFSKKKTHETHKVIGVKKRNQNKTSSEDAMKSREQTLGKQIDEMSQRNALVDLRLSRDENTTTDDFLWQSYARERLERAKHLFQLEEEISTRTSHLGSMNRDDDDDDNNNNRINKRKGNHNTNDEEDEFFEPVIRDRDNDDFSEQIQTEFDQAHFGGGSYRKDKPLKEIYQEIITKDKKYKQEKKRNKEKEEVQRELIDSEFESIREMVMSNRREKKIKGGNILQMIQDMQQQSEKQNGDEQKHADGQQSEITQFPNQMKKVKRKREREQQLEQEQEQEINQNQQSGFESDFDQRVKMLSFQSKAKAGEKTKTSEELASEQRKKLEDLEEERLKRMHLKIDEEEQEQDDDDQQQDEDDDNEDKQSNMDGDDLDDDYNERRSDSYSNSSDDESEVESQVSKRTDKSKEKEKEKINEKQKQMNKPDKQKSIQIKIGGIDAPYLIENVPSTLEDWIDVINSLQPQNQQNDTKLKESNEKEKKKSKKKQPKDQKEDQKPALTQQQQQLQQIIQTDISAATIADRISKSCSVKLNTDNTPKMQRFFNVLIQYLSDNKSDSKSKEEGKMNQILDSQSVQIHISRFRAFFKPVWEIGTSMPGWATKLALDDLRRIFNSISEVQHNQSLQQQITSSSSSSSSFHQQPSPINIQSSLPYSFNSSLPSLPQILKLLLYTRMFPVTDAIHPVITPLVLLIVHSLEQASNILGKEIDNQISSIDRLHLPQSTSSSQKHKKQKSKSKSDIATPYQQNPLLIIPVLSDPLISDIGRGVMLCCVLFECICCSARYLAEPLIYLRTSAQWVVQKIQLASSIRSSSIGSYILLLSTISRIVHFFANLYQSTPAFIEIFEPIHQIISFGLQQINNYFPSETSDNTTDNSILNLKKVLIQVCKSLHEVLTLHQQARIPLQLAPKKIKVIQELEPQFSSEYMSRGSKEFEREEMKRLKRKEVRERKGASREIRKDTQYIMEKKEKEEQKKDEKDKKKQKSFMALLEEQQADKNLMDKMKTRQKKHRRRDKNK
ncbi:MAG: putative nucleolar protein 14 [Streblomastix strix]|uniref:Putative nucleolar protein 14 n=1 Tax=Streblomastix strix TaxID=222440 RepID=A0A5J4WP87_9EUKA|nr:MAG: putative nucleolar protein 14 [Streblomastix strix]